VISQELTAHEIASMPTRVTAAPVVCGKGYGASGCILDMTTLSARLFQSEGMRHILRPNPFVELFRGQEAQL
jgi:hypothetical protein